MSEKPITIIILAVLTLAITIYLTTQPRQMPIPAGLGVEDFGPSPDLSLPLGKGGQKVELSSLHGHVVMLDFWATWCQPCKMSIPELEAVYEKHRHEGLQVIGLSVDDEQHRKDVAPIMQSLGMTYPSIFADDVVDIRSKFTFASIPMLIVIDKKGIIRARMSGYDPHADLDGIVTQLVKERYVDSP